MIVNTLYNLINNNSLNYLHLDFVLYEITIMLENITPSYRNPQFIRKY